MRKILPAILILLAMCEVNAAFNESVIRISFFFCPIFLMVAFLTICISLILLENKKE
jgi:hypothetical protein